MEQIDGDPEKGAENNKNNDVVYPLNRMPLLLRKLVGCGDGWVLEVELKSPGQTASPPHGRQIDCPASEHPHKHKRANLTSRSPGL